MTIHLDAFSEGNEVRRGIEPNPAPGLSVCCLEEGADGPLSIRAGHVNEPEVVLGKAAARGQLERGFKAGLKAENLKAPQKADGFRVGHRNDRTDNPGG